MTIVIGTRGSLLARTQTGHVASQLESALGIRTRLQVIRTEGDDLRLSLHSAPRPGVFVSALREALVDGRVDVVVHSMKDLPSAPASGITLAATLERQDPRDVVITRSGATLADLPRGSVVGTSSPRRIAFIRRERPDLVCRPVRGNVDSRIAKMLAGEVDALMLAAAGLRRIGRESEITEFLEIDRIVPAPAQGALAIECRSADGGTVSDLAGLRHEPTWWAARAERAVLAGVAATCATAVGAHLTPEHLVADLDDERGYRRVVLPREGDDPTALGARAAAALMEE